MIGKGDVGADKGGTGVDDATGADFLRVDDGAVSCCRFALYFGLKDFN